MNFTVRPEIFEKFPDYVVGVVLLRGADNTVAPPNDILRLACETAVQCLGIDPKNHPMVKIWRDAFSSVGYNPNKFPPSIDALSSRIVKAGSIPSINAAVDIINSHSLSYLLPMGAHDTDLLVGDFEVRASRPHEIFTPMGAAEQEEAPEGEFVYADTAEIRTRRWIWRQGDKAKVTAHTKSLFCPIDGFSNSNLDAVMRARESLASVLQLHLGGIAVQRLVHVNNPSIPIG